MDAFVFPFRFASGRALRVDDTSEQFAAQMIGAAIQTGIGELPITVDFGSVDAAFGTFDEANMTRTIANYTSNVIIDQVSQTIENDRVAIVVEFSLTEG